MLFLPLYLWRFSWVWASKRNGGLGFTALNHVTRGPHTISVLLIRPLGSLCECSSFPLGAQRVCLLEGTWLPHVELNKALEPRQDQPSKS